MIQHISYSHDGLESCRILSARIRAKVPTRSFDTMVGIGISGALVVPALGRHMRKHWALARKSGVNSHAGNVPFEGTIGTRVLIVDDQISTGATVAVILRKLTDISERYQIPQPAVIGVYQYNGGGAYATMAVLARGYSQVDEAWSTSAKVPLTPGRKSGDCECGCED
jgi:hypoxanthine phosphoribosyltransferase